MMLTPISQILTSNLSFVVVKFDPRYSKSFSTLCSGANFKFFSFGAKD